MAHYALFSELEGCPSPEFQTFAHLLHKQVQSVYGPHGQVYHNCSISGPIVYLSSFSHCLYQYPMRSFIREEQFILVHKIQYTVVGKALGLEYGQMLTLYPK